MGKGKKGFKPKKKPAWNYKEIPEDPEVSKLMPGFEIQYMITEATVEGNDRAIFGHCIFPPNSAHEKHQHLNAAEVVYTIKGNIINGITTEKGDVETVCPPGTAAFAKPGQVHWTRNATDAPVEIVFCYYGCASLEASGYVDDIKD